LGKSEITVLTRLLALFHAFDKSIGIAALPIDIFRWLGFTREQYENNLTVGDARTGDSSPENESESGPGFRFRPTQLRAPDCLMAV